MIFDATREADGEISVIIPPLKNMIKEGVYDMGLEVIVDDKYFRPLNLKGKFEKMVKVTAEAVVKRKKKTGSKPTASLVEVSRSNKKPVVAKARRKKQTKQSSQVTDQQILDIIKQLAR